MKKWTQIFIALIVLFTLSGCNSNDPIVEQSTNEEITDRPFEGTTLELLVAYGGADASFEAFTKETGIEIEWISMSTGNALAKLQAEDGQTTADIWFGGGVDSYLNARDLGYLHSYKSPETSAIDAQFVDPDGYFTGLALVPAGFIVNTDILEEKGLEAPKTWADLLDPKYKGEIIMANPAVSGTQYAILSGLIQALGEEEAWEYFRKLDENIDFYAQGGGEPQQKVAAGEFAIGVTAVHGATINVAQSAPTMTILPEDYIPWTPAPIAIFENTENLEAAKLFVDWFLSFEGQTVLMEADARIMARNDVDPPAEMSTLDKTKLIDFDLEKMGRDREMILEQWKEISGE